MQKPTTFTSPINKNGNRCGFLLSLPRFLPEHPHPLIADIERRCQRLFRERQGKNKFFWGRKRIRASKRGASGTVHDRPARAERAEAIAMVAQCCWKHTELRNKRILARPGLDVGMTVADIARETGFSIDRVKGALYDLQSCGYINGYQRHDELPNGKFKGLPAMRWWTDKFLETMGVAKKLKAFLKGGGVLVIIKPKAPEPEPETPTGPLRRKIESLKWIVAHEHPEFSLDQVEAEAQRRAAE